MKQHDFFMVKGATLNGEYRYSLQRQWSFPPAVREPCGETVTYLFADRYVLFIMLNPSTADDAIDDPTIRRCIGFARTWGYGGVHVGNLYALRSTDPARLLTHPAPVGPHNDDHLRALISGAETVICAWGAHRAAGLRGSVVVELIEAAGKKPMCLKISKEGAPWHPLYVRGDTKPIPYRWSAA